MPATVVLGIGAVLLPVPPVAVVYHIKFVPVAESAVAVTFWQYVTDETTTGAAGSAVTVTVIAERGLSHVPCV